MGAVQNTLGAAMGVMAAVSMIQQQRAQQEAARQEQERIRREQERLRQEQERQELEAKWNRYREIAQQARNPRGDQAQQLPQQHAQASSTAAALDKRKKILELERMRRKAQQDATASQPAAGSFNPWEGGKVIGPEKDPFPPMENPFETAETPPAAGSFNPWEGGKVIGPEKDPFPPMENPFEKVEPRGPPAREYNTAVLDLDRDPGAVQGQPGLESPAPPGETRGGFLSSIGNVVSNLKDMIPDIDFSLDGVERACESFKQSLAASPAGEAAGTAIEAFKDQLADALEGKLGLNSAKEAAEKVKQYLMDNYDPRKRLDIARDVLE